MTVGTRGANQKFKALKPTTDKMTHHLYMYI